MPRVRQVVHRGFVNDQHENASSDRLVFTTDVRSSKAMDIASCSNAPVELAWYIAPERVQFRIQGAAYLLPAPTHKWRAQFPDAQLAISDTNFAWDEERERFWRLLSPRMQNTFFGPPPGQPVPPIATAESSSLSPTPRPQHQIQSPHERNLREPNAIPESFALVIIEPHKVDVLELKHAQRTIYEREVNGAWNGTSVAP